MRCILLRIAWSAIIFLNSVQLLHSQPQIYPHRQSTFEYRVTNRRYISHILYENRVGKHYVTILTTHGGVWAYHAGSHALYYPCAQITNCLRELTRLNKFLLNGWNIGLHLQGSMIHKIDYYPEP